IHPDLYFDPGYGFDPAAGDVMVICPGESVQSTEVTVEDATLVIGCSSEPASPYYCEMPTANFKDFYGTPKSCSGFDPNAKVTIATKPTTDLSYPDQGQYALWVRDGGRPGTGQIVVLSPMEIYYDDKGAQGGFNLGGGGIRNQRTRSNGAIDPDAVAIFGGKDQQVSSNYISTSEPFYGKIFNPYADVMFTNTDPLDFHGAINARGITTSSTVKIHWDQSFKYPTGGVDGEGDACDPAQSNCRPVAGSWQLLVN
ncbi:MAG: hypothetical protein Q8R91_08075, partial [Candidatus Omnitrophota bacterium]|nr:hypothetical protein [Candidatus Omnitrophota bacterium]